MTDKLKLRTAEGTVKYDFSRKRSKFNDKFEVVLVFDPERPEVKEMVETLEAFEKTSTGGATLPYPVVKRKDGEIHIKAKSDFEVKVVDWNLNDVDEGLSLQGCKAQMEILAKPYDATFGAGVTLYLQGVQVLTEPKPWGAGATFTKSAAPAGYEESARSAAGPDRGVINSEAPDNEVPF